MAEVGESRRIDGQGASGLFEAPADDTSDSPQPDAIPRL